MGIIANAQAVIFLVLALIGFALEIWALVHCLTTPARAFTAEGKRTKNFWLALTAVAVAVGFLGIPPPIGLSGNLIFILGPVVVAAVYLADVRPAVAAHRRRTGGGSGGGLPRPKKRDDDDFPDVGGWRF